MDSIKKIAVKSVKDLMLIANELYKLESNNNLNVKNSSSIINEFKKYDEINDDQEKLKVMYKMMKFDTEHSINKTSKDALFIYLHAIFEKNTQKIIEHNIKSNKKIKEKYFEFLIKKNTDLIKKKSRELFDASFLSLDGKEKAKKSLEYLPFIYQDIGQLRLLDTLLGVTETKNFTNSIKWYYESRERRNLIVHRNNEIDNIYLKNIKLKKINIKNFYEPIFLDPKKIKLGERVKTGSIYCHFIIYNMIKILMRYLSYSLESQENREDMMIETMHSILDKNYLLHSNYSKQIFIAPFNLFLNSDLYKIYKKDFQISDSKKLFFFTNFALSIKDIKNNNLNEWLKEKEIAKTFSNTSLGLCILNILTKKYDLAIQNLLKCKNEKILNFDDGFYWQAFYEWHLFRDLHHKKEYKEAFEKLSGKRWDPSLLKY